MWKCSGVLQCSDGVSNKVSYIIRRLVDNYEVVAYMYFTSTIITIFLSMYIWFYSCLIM